MKHLGRFMVSTSLNSRQHNSYLYVFIHSAHSTALLGLQQVQTYVITRVEKHKNKTHLSSKHKQTRVLLGFGLKSRRVKTFHR